MTVDEFLALPDDPSVRRELINGELREETVTTRNPRHAGCVGLITHAIHSWLAATKISNVFIGTGKRNRGRQSSGYFMCKSWTG